MWRDMMARIEGPVVSDIQGVVRGKLARVLRRDPDRAARPTSRTARSATAAAFAIKSSPADRATASRVLFQTLSKSATGEVLISTPYFLPDKAFREAICRTAARGVEITRDRAGRRTPISAGCAWRAGACTASCSKPACGSSSTTPGMTHVKALLVDDLWAVIGTTNLDNRSFEHNDEVNVAFRERRGERRG